MERRTAFFYNHFFLVDNGEIIGVQCDNDYIMLGDTVRIKGDAIGYIAPGIAKEGYGTVVDFADNNTDHYYGVRMDNGEYAHVKRARITEVIPGKRYLRVYIKRIN